MSAFVVPIEHVHAIVGFARDHCRWGVRIDGGATLDLGDPSQADALGAILVQANCASVNFRYGMSDPAAEYRWERVSPLTPVGCLKAIACLSYQSCEVDGWEDTVAYMILRQIEAAAIRALPGYEEAPWVIEGRKT